MSDRPEIKVDVLARLIVAGLDTKEEDEEEIVEVRAAFERKR